ncbi:MAG: tail fiber domain-containing protein [Candidatus Babeliaceae bacterium]|nr:tail fiber domain-containing protein [Candidatus Babeliaceae bacterium]
MKQLFLSVKIIFLIGVFNACFMHATLSRELEKYIEAIKYIDKCLSEKSLDPAAIIQDHDVLELINVFDEIKAQLPVEEQEILQQIIDRIRSAVLTSKAPRIGAPSYITSEAVVDERYYYPRDEYLRNLLVTGSLVAPGFSGGDSVVGGPFLPLAGGTMTGNIDMSQQTAIVFEDATNSNSVTIQAPASVAPVSYVLNLPVSDGTLNQALVTDGAGNLSWSSAIATTSGIQSINNLTAPNQFLTTGQAGSAPQFDSVINTHTLNIPLASKSGVTAGLISNADYNNFNMKLSTTGGTMTGPLIMTSTLVLQNCNKIIFNNSDDTLSIALRAPCPTVAPGTNVMIQLPSYQGELNQVLAQNPIGQLTWVTTVTDSKAISLLYSATPADIPNTLVLRDGTGSFAATNVTVTSVIFQGQNGNYISMNSANPTSDYGITLPDDAPMASQALLFDGSQYIWATVQTTTQGIQSINNLTAVNQFLSTGTQFNTLGWTTIGTATNNLNIPYAGNLPNNNSQVGLITGADYYNFNNSYTTVQAGTPLDIPNTLVRRDETGSFAATNITLTGALYLRDSSDNLQGKIFAIPSALVISPSFSDAIQTTTFGDQRGLGAIDLQSFGNLSSQVASGVLSALLGGNSNTASGDFSAVVGGINNIALGTASFIGGGGSFSNGNLASGDNSAVVGGENNQATAQYSSVLGGRGNTASEIAASVVGGGVIDDGRGTFYYGNVSDGYSTFVGGGFGNSANGFAAAILGGQFNTANGGYSGIVSGSGNLTTGNFSVAMGHGAQAVSNGSFVFADSQDPLYNSFAENTFNIRAQNGLVLSGTAPNDFSTNSVVLKVGDSTITYSLILPLQQATGPNQALINDGSGNLSWAQTLTGGIESLNGATASAQFLITSTSASTLVEWITLYNNTNELNIPYAGNLLGTNSVGLISGIDYQDFYNSYTTVQAGTPLDIPNTLVKRDGTGSFQATNVGLVASDASGTVTLGAQNSSSSYSLQFPTTVGIAGQLLENSSTPGQLQWISISEIVSGTVCDLPNTIVARDTNGMFVATTISLTGNSLIDYGSSDQCLPGAPFILAPQNGNTIISLFNTSAAPDTATIGGNNTVFGYNALAAIATGSGNTAIGAGAGSAVTTGTGNIYIGLNAGAGHTGNSSIFLGYNGVASGDNLIYIGNPSNSTVSNCAPNSDTTTTIYGCINLPEVNCGTGYIASFDTNGQLIKAMSSKRYKDNIKSLASMLTDKIYNLRPTEFNFKNSPNMSSYGLIAEEVEVACPELVIHNEAGEPDSVNYLSAQIFALDALIKQRMHINELVTRCDVLTRMITNQNEAIAQLQQQINNLVQ